MFLWKCNCFPLLLIDKKQKCWNVQSFRNVTWTHKLAMNLTPDPYRKWTWVPWVRSVFHFGLVSAYKYYNLNSLGCQWLWQNNLNPSMDILPWTTSTPTLQTLWGGGLRFISRSSSQMGSLHFLQSENPKPSRRQSPDLPHLSMLPSAPFVLSACLVSEISSEVFLILVNSFLLLIALFHVLCWTPKVSVLTVYMNDLFRRRGT